MMFYEDDYPDWVDELYNSFDDKVPFCIRSDVFERIKQHDNAPHIGNIIVEVLFENIANSLAKDYNLERDDFNFYINALCSSIDYKGSDFKTLGDFKDIMEEENGRA